MKEQVFSVQHSTCCYHTISCINLLDFIHLLGYVALVIPDVSNSYFFHTFSRELVSLLGAVQLGMC